MGGEKDKNQSSTKSIEDGKQEGQTEEDKPATKKPTKKSKKPNESKSRIKRVPVAPAAPSTRRVATTPRAKPPTLTARQAGKRSSRGTPVRKPIGPPKPLNIEVESTIVDGLNKEDIDFKGRNSILTRMLKKLVRS